MTLTPTEIESLRIAIAEECGWEYSAECGSGECPCGFPWSNKLTGHISGRIPPYTTSLDAIQEAAMERFKELHEITLFGRNLSLQTEFAAASYIWQLTALDWCIAFARTAKI